MASAAGETGTVAYEFAQPPSAVPPKRALYRDPSAPRRTSNMMHDRRVVRGNTYAIPVMPPSLQAEMERKQKDEEDRRKRRLTESRRRAEEESRAVTPEPLPGRAHQDMQTETFLEVLSDRVPEEEVGVQTDAMMDRPPSPLFVPKPSGVDKVTQIEANDLFDFDYEVAPVLEVLVGKTLETALMEVLQEAELAALRARQEEFENIRNAELAEAQRLEAEVARRAGEKLRRVEQERLRVKREGEMQQKIAAAAFSKSYLASMRKNVMAKLAAEGYFYDPLVREIETTVMPDVLAAVAARTLVREGVATALLDDLIASALSHGAGVYGSIVAKAREEREAIAAAARAAAEAEAAAAAAAALAEAAAANPPKPAEGEEGEEGAAEGDAAEGGDADAQAAE